MKGADFRLGGGGAITQAKTRSIQTDHGVQETPRTTTVSSYETGGVSKLHKTKQPRGTMSAIVGTMKRNVAAVLLGTMLATPGVALAQNMAAHDMQNFTPPAVTEVIETSEADSSFAESFEAGLKEGKEKRAVAAKIGMAPGQVLVSSDIPVVRNIGETVKKAGQAVTSPFTILAGIFTLDGDRIKEGFEDLGRGTLGTVGLEHVVMGDYHKPGQGITGAVALPSAYAESIKEAKSDWRSYSEKERNRDYAHGMKKWHTLSNAKMSARAGVLELPWIFLGGIAHELDPGGVSAEVNTQGFGAWLMDTPLDVVANTLGMVGGVLLPEDAHQEYARVVGNIVPGPYDPFEQPKPDDAKSSVTDSGPSE